eukprot:TRINITY_DN75070_c0_g1_i1.p1 TRINITY_DN75070_c0_g1~~TRINITY_DN75070_c0_g1_i1.p1  ORF type:complete len:120 (+),score=27.64 TRINITY_DN75070_c0_g1_i1:1-360(+)
METWQRDASERPACTAKRLAEAIGTHEERTDRALRWNEELRRKAERAGFRFAAIGGRLLDPKTGIVQRLYVKPHSKDIHLDIAELAPLYHEEYIRLGLDFAVAREALPDLYLSTVFGDV